jgi:hypothetical protein
MGDNNSLIFNKKNQFPLAQNREVYLEFGWLAVAIRECFFD